MVDFYRHINMRPEAAEYLSEEELHWFRAESQRQMMLNTDDQRKLNIVEKFKTMLDAEYDRRHSIFK